MGVLNEEKQNEIVKKYIKSIGIKCTGINQPIQEYQVVINKKLFWLVRCSFKSFVNIDEPTRGIDVGAKNEIQIIIDFAKRFECINDIIRIGRNY